MTAPGTLAAPSQAVRGDRVYNSRMLRDPASGSEIEDVDPQPLGVDGHPALPPPRGPGRRSRRRSGLARWVPVLGVAGLGLLIIGAGFAGPKVPAPDERSASPPPTSPAASPVATPVPSPAGSSLPEPAGLRLHGALPPDPFVLLAGRWVNLAAGVPEGATPCELERALVLSGGRIVCIAQEVIRAQGSTLSVYNLSVVTLGHTRDAGDQPPVGAPPHEAADYLAAVPLVTLSGRRDLVIGDPVAVAAIPGAEDGSLLLAWAVLRDDGFHVGLDRYRVDGAAAMRTGRRELPTVAFEAADGFTSLADLGVSMSPDGLDALVGVTIVPAPPGRSVRRLAVLRMDDRAAAGASLGAPLVLPDSVTALLSTPAIASVDATPCGGRLGEGWADVTTVFAVCPGEPPAFRRIRLALGGADRATSSAADAAPAAGRVAATVLDEAAFSPARATTDWLAGSGVAIDREHGRYYRWVPRASILWAIDLLAGPGAEPIVEHVHVDAGLAPLAADGSDDGAGPRQTVALDAAHGRLYVLAPDSRGHGSVVAALDTTGPSQLRAASMPGETFQAMTLSPDGTLLYLVTPPRGVEGASRPLVAVAVLDADLLTERLFAGRLPPGAWDPGQPLVVR